MCCLHPSHTASADRRIQAASSLTTSARHGTAMGPQARARPPLRDEATQASLPAFLALCPSLLFACLIFSLECRWNISLWLRVPCFSSVSSGHFFCCLVLPLLPLFPIPQIWDNNVVLLWHVFLPYLPAQNYAWCSILWFGWFSYSPVWFSFTPRPWFF